GGFLATPEPAHVVRDASVGVLFPSVEAKIVDDAGALLPRNQRGNVYMRTPFVMKGYLNEPGQSLDAITKEGWIRTGDIGFVNEQDQLYIVGRSKDLFKIKGDNVTGAEIEAALLRHAEVKDVAVIPVLLPGDLEPVPRGYIVKTEQSTLSIAALTSWMEQHHPPEMALIGGTSFLDEIPIANLGNSKVDRLYLARLAERELSISNGRA
ncbi:hypothetical protein BJY01DRAFT_254475, partial [Aspergillus pseudoustus]